MNTPTYNRDLAEATKLLLAQVTAFESHCLNSALACTCSYRSSLPLDDKGESGLFNVSGDELLGRQAFGQPPGQEGCRRPARRLISQLVSRNRCCFTLQAKR